MTFGEGPPGESATALSRSVSLVTSSLLRFDGRAGLLTVLLARDSFVDNEASFGYPWIDIVRSS